MCQSILQLYWKGTLAKMSPCEFCEISKCTSFRKHLRETACAIILTHFRSMSPLNLKLYTTLFCGISCIVVHSLQRKNFLDVGLLGGQIRIKLENDYTAVVTNKASNKPVTGFFLIAKNFYFAFDFKWLNVLNLESNYIALTFLLMSPPKVIKWIVLLGKGVLIGEHPCQSAISIKLLCNFTEIGLRHGCSPINLLCIFRTLIPKNTSGGLLLYIFESFDVSSTIFPAFYLACILDFFILL